ncbi:YeeE/YedE family protein [uncultured Sulfitobacter sp.]|uniref:YeeE/YedE family protein n=1 Tax=uncultured Sulfitobacter sp. TaxID=191468 RepID=UPI00260C2082|nr:YeeE/YedE family protein [uncultured Sulfitobacter sp.]
MFEELGFENLTAPEAVVYFALVIGVAFGVLAQITKFCFRRTLVGEDRRAAAGVWFTALAVAVAGTQAAVSAELIEFSDHRLLAGDLPWLAIVVGGLLFGAGMVLTRGCASRLTVLGGSGNLRALTVLVVFAITAHATMKGLFAPIRVALGNVTVPLGDMTTLAALPGGAWLFTALIIAAAVFIAARSGVHPTMLITAALLGALVPLAWVGTGFILYDDFDVIPMESLSFTRPASDTLFWTIAGTSISPGFGTGLIGGVLLGAFAASVATGTFVWQSFESAAQTGRYMGGAVLMGIGGVLAGGCTVGAGLSGVPTLSIAAILAITTMAAGAWITHALLTRSASARGARPTTRDLQPAE